jgi:hypothetical protein
MKRAIVLAVVLTATVVSGQWLETAITLPHELHRSDNAMFDTLRAQYLTPPRVWVDSTYLPDTVDTMMTIVPMAAICLDPPCLACSTWFWILDSSQRSVYVQSLVLTLPGGRRTVMAYPGVRFTTLGTHVARCSAYCYGHIPDTAAVREFEVVPYQIGTEEPGWPSARCTWSYATMVRGVLRVPESAIRHSTFALLNSVGRKVMELMPGENDVSRIAPGVYFVFRASGVEREASSVRKVVIQR